MSRYRVTIISLTALFLAVNVAWLHRVPGLMGDEASEGQNVYELLERDRITIVGERSYIGPLIDYVRVPFVGGFGYTALAMRVPMLLASLATWLMAASVFRHWLGAEASLFPLVVMGFSLPYLTYQRLGWAITLFPFFFFLTVWLGQRDWRHKWLLVGLSAGLGLHSHIMFLPTLAGLAAAGFTGYWLGPAYAKASAGNNRGKVKRLLDFLPAVISFWAGFATQFVVLQIFPEDQGDPTAVGEAWSERLAALSDLLPVILSGSSYVARYTGVEFSSASAQAVMWLVMALALLGVVLAWRKRAIWLWLVGLAVHLLVLLYMIDRFSLRYFVMFVLGIYVLAGVGVGETLAGLNLLLKKKWFLSMKVMGIAGVMSLLWAWLVLIPFLKTGGSVAEFSLGNRTDSASALVDVRPLLPCLRGAGTVSSENVHIYNRLLYLGHEYDDLIVINENEAASADLLVHYRGPKSQTVAASDERCPTLANFVVEQNRNLDAGGE